jgi:hypothetical protein
MGDSMSTIINATTTNGVVIQPDNSGSLVLQTNSGTTALTIDTSQNVGIGTTSPTALRTKNLEVSSAGANDGAAVIVGKRGSGIATLRLTGLDTTVGTDINFNFPNTGDLGFFDRASSTNRLTIDSSGNLAVANTVSGYTAGSKGFLVRNDSASGTYLQIGATTTSSFDVAYFYNPNGNVGKISVSGSNTSYVTSSDYRLKENIVPMTGALDVVSALKPVTYTWKVDGSEGQGFIAHELQEVVPDCVSGEKDAVDTEGNPQYQGIDTSFLVATLTAAIQEQQTIINDLKARVETLEAK